MSDRLSFRGFLGHRNKLTVDDRKKIVELLLAGVQPIPIARRFNISPTYVRRIRRAAGIPTPLAPKRTGRDYLPANL